MTANKSTPEERENVSEGQSSSERDAETTDIGSAKAWTSIETPSLSEAHGPIDVKGEWLDDEPGGVHLSASVDGGRVIISLDPEEAKALAAKISSAATYAEGGDR